MAEQAVLSDEQLLALSYEDLCDTDYLLKACTELGRLDEPVPPARWLVSPLLPEDALNFGADPALGAALVRRRAGLEQARERAPPLDMLGRQALVFAHVARVSLRLLAQSAPAAPPSILPSPPESLLGMAVRAALGNALEVRGGRVRLHVFEVALSSLLDVFKAQDGEDTLPSHAAQVVAALAHRFAQSLEEARAATDLRVALDALTLASMCSAGAAKLCLRSSDSATLLIVVCQLLALKARTEELLDAFEPDACPAPSVCREEEEGARLLRKLSEAKMAGRTPLVSPLASQGAGADAWRARPPEETRVGVGNRRPAAAPSKDLPSRLRSSTPSGGARPNQQQEQQPEPPSGRVRRLLDRALALSSVVPADLHLAAASMRGPSVRAADLASSEVHTVGQNSYGELAHCDVEPRRSFCRVGGLEGRVVVAVGAGNEHSVFVSRAGAVLVAGYNDNGQCGVGSHGQVRAPVALASLERERVVRVLASNGCEHTLVITQGGRLYSFGYNYRGQLGLGHSSSEPTPMLVQALTGHKVVLGACSYHHSVVLTSEGALFAFGRNDFAQLGLGDTSDRRLPTLVPDAPLEVVSLSCGQFHTVLVTRQGDVWVTGRNEFGQLMLEGAEAVRTLTPLPRASTGGRVVKAVCGYYHTLLLTQTGAVLAGGRNDYGQLGLGHSQSKVLGVNPVRGLQDRRIVDVACGCYHSVAVAFNGMLYVFGRNNHGQLGAGDTEERLTPQPVDAFLGRRVVSVACGFYHTVVLSTGADEEEPLPCMDLPAAVGLSRRTADRDLVLFLVERIDGERADPPPVDPRLAHAQLASASVLLRLCLEHLLLPAETRPALPLFSQADALGLLARTLRCVRGVLQSNAAALRAALEQEEKEREEGEEEEVVESAALSQASVSPDLCAHVRRLCSEEARAVLPLLAQTSADLLLLLSCRAPPLLGRAQSEAAHCLAHLHLLLPAPRRRLSLLRGLAGCVARNVRDEVMLANGARPTSRDRPDCADACVAESECAHVCRCASLCGLLSAQLASNRAALLLLQADWRSGVGTLLCLLSLGPDIARMLRPALLRHVGDAHAELRAALGAVEQGALCLVKAAVPAILAGEHSEGALVVEAVFRSSVEALAVRDEGKVPPSLLPVFLLLASHARLASPLTALALLRCSEDLALRLPSLARGRDGAWADRVGRLCVGVCARAAAFLSRVSAASPPADSPLWVHLCVGEAAVDAEAVAQTELLQEPLLQGLDRLRAATASEDPGYALLASMADGPSLRALEALVFRAALESTRHCGGRGRTWGKQLEAWRAARALSKALCARRSRLLCPWSHALALAVALAARCAALVRGCVCPFSALPLPPARPSHPRLRAALLLVLCSVRWRRAALAIEAHARTVAAAAAALVSKVVLDAVDAADDTTAAEAVWGATSAALGEEQLARGRRAVALAAVARFLQSPLFRPGAADVLEALADATRGCDRSRVQPSFCSALLRAEERRAADQLFDCALLDCLADSCGRVLGPLSAPELRLLRSAASVATLHADALSLDEARAAGLLRAVQRAFAQLADQSAESEARSRHQGRDHARLLRGAADQLTLLLLEWALRVEESDRPLGHVFALLCETVLAMLAHLHLSYFRNSRVEPGCDETEDSSRASPKRKCQELVSRPLQFRRDREGMVVQGDKLCTNFKGIDFSLALWVHLHRRPVGKASFIAGKVSHADAWPLLLLRPDGRLEVVFGKGGEADRFTSKAVLSLGGWVHICVATEPRKMKLFVNGALDSSAGTAGNTRATLYPVVVGSCPLGVRTRVEHVRDGFDGLLGSLTYHTRALSPAHVKHLFEGGPPESCDARLTWGYRLLTALRMLCRRAVRGRHSVDLQPAAELCLAMLYATTGSMRSLSADVLLLLLGHDCAGDLVLAVARDERLKLMGMEGAAPASILALAFLDDAPCFRERLALLLLRLVGCCWEPSVISSCASESSNASGNHVWSDYFVNKRLKELVVYAPEMLSSTILNTIFSPSSRPRVRECDTASLAEFSHVCSGLLRALCELSPLWSVAVSNVVERIALDSVALVEAAAGWRCLPLVEALGVGALLGQSDRPLCAGASVRSAYSGEEGRLIHVDSAMAQVTFLARDGRSGAARLVSQYASDLRAVEGAHEVALQPSAAAAVALLVDRLSPFAQVVASDLLVGVRGDHPFVRALVRGVRAVELFLFKCLLSFACECEELPALACKQLLLQLSIRMSRAPSKRATPEAALVAAWIECSGYTLRSLGPTHIDAFPPATAEKHFAEFVGKHMLIAADGFKNPQQLHLLRRGAFAELVFHVSTGRESFAPEEEQLQWGVGHENTVSEREGTDLFRLAAAFRASVLLLLRRFLVRACAVRSPLDALLCCQVALEAEGPRSRHAHAARRLRDDMFAHADLGSVPSGIRYMALSLFKTTSLRSSESIVDTTDLFSRLVVCAHAYLLFNRRTQSVSELDCCHGMLRVLLPLLSFVKGSGIEQRLIGVCAHAMDGVLGLVFAGAEVPRELEEMARSGAHGQLRRRAQEALLQDRCSGVAQDLALLAVGLETIQRRTVAAEPDEAGEAGEAEAKEVSTPAPRLVEITAGSVELDLSQCFECSPTPALLEVALGVAVQGEETEFYPIYAGSAHRVGEAGLASGCGYSVRCRLLLPGATWSAALDFCTCKGPPFAFDGTRSGPDIAISGDGLVASYSGDDCWSTVLGSQSFSSGCVAWEMRIVQSSTAYIFVGVAKSYSDLNTFLGGDENGWGFIGEQALYHSREKVQVYGESFCKGDVVGVALDLAQGTLSFSRNGKTLGVGFTGVFGELFPAVAFYNVGQEVQLVPEGFRASAPQHPIYLSPGRVQLDELGRLTDLIGSLCARQPVPAYLARHLTGYCNAWCEAAWVRRRTASGSFVSAARRAPLLDLLMLRHGDRVRTPLGLAVVVGVAHGRLWLQMGGSEEVWFFSKQQLLAGQAAGLFLRPTYREDEVSPKVEPAYQFDAQLFASLVAPSGWTEELDAALMGALAELADAGGLSVWDLGPDELLGGFRALQQPLVRCVMRDPRLCAHWGIRGPSRRAVLARCALVRYLNELLQRNLHVVPLSEEPPAPPESALEEAAPVVTCIHTGAKPDDACLPAAAEAATVMSRRSFGVAQLRALVYLEAKVAHLNEVLLKSGEKPAKTDDEYDYPEDLPQVRLSRFKSLRAAELAEEHGMRGEELVFQSMFCQLWRELRSHPASRMRVAYTHPMDDGQARAFKVRFDGEGVDDYGGPYRDVFQFIVEELQRTRGADCFFPLLRPTSNWTAPDCDERYKFTFCPSQTSAFSLDLYLFLGQFVGMALRSKITLDLALPSLVWKMVVLQATGEADLRSVDESFHGFVAHLRGVSARLRGDGEEAQAAAAEAGDILQDLSWTVALTDGRRVELCEGGAGKSVAVADLDEYLDKAVRARLDESAVAVEAFRAGVLSVVPWAGVELLGWRELELLVCGSRVIDVARLQANTEYDDDVSATDAHIAFFWAVLREFSDAERSAFLRFVWARPTLPPKGVPFPQKMRVQSVLEDPSVSADAYLPKAHTCFFSINLPRYSSKAVTADKLRYAIVNCTEMDADYKLTDTDDVAGWSLNQSNNWSLPI